MSKWLLVHSAMEYGPYGKTPQGFLRECFTIKYALEQNGQEADYWGLRHNNYDNPPDFNSYDYILMLENYEFDWIPWNKIKESKAIKLQWWADIHVHKTYLQWVDLFDIILNPIKQLVLPYKEQFPNQKHIWFPSAMDGRYYNIANVKNKTHKTYDVVWLGTCSRPYVQELKKEVGLYNKLRSGWDYINTIADSKVALNRRGSIDLNYKNYEITGLGTCLVTDYDPAYEELGFIDDVNCYFYKNYDECLFKIRKALKDYNWLRLGAEGYTLSRRHTWEKRIERLLKIIQNNDDGYNFVLDIQTKI